MPLLSFEGIDGSGKSTQIKLLCNWLATKSIEPLIYREPGGTKLSESVRSLLLDKNQNINPLAELLLFSAARAQLISEKIEPALSAGKWVILDRFYDSTTAYQGYGRAILPIEQIHLLNDLATNKLVPDVTFYLDINLDASIERRKGIENDRMESAGSIFFSKIIDGYREIAKNEKRIEQIDARRDVNAIHFEIIDKIASKFQKELA